MAEEPKIEESSTKKEKSREVEMEKKYQGTLIPTPRTRVKTQGPVTRQRDVYHIYRTAVDRGGSPWVGETARGKHPPKPRHYQGAKRSS